MFFFSMLHLFTSSCNIRTNWFTRSHSMVGGMRKLTSLYKKATGKATDAGDGSGKRPRGRPPGRPRGGGRGGGGASIPAVEEETESPLGAAESESDSPIPTAATQSGDEEEQVDQGGSSSSTSSRVWLRGPSSLPRRPVPMARRPLIRPDGEK